jgi:hypothetical protein
MGTIDFERQQQSKLELLKMKIEAGVVDSMSV